MKIVFEKGDRGLICRSPEDGGAWVVPAHRERHAAPLVDGHIMAVEIVGASANGRLRYVRIVEDISASQEGALENIKRMAASAATFDELKGKKWGAISVAPHVSPWTLDIKTCLDVEGRPAVEAVKVNGFYRAEWCKAKLCTYDAPMVKLERPLPLGPADTPLALGYHVVAMATRYTSATPPTWATEFVAQVGELSEAVRLLEERTGEKWHPRSKPQGFEEDWPLMHWLRDEAKRIGATNLRELIAQVDLPLKEVKVQLAALTTDRPTHIRFNDGYERTIKWSGRYGEVEVSAGVFSTLALHPADPRAAAIASAGHTLWLETSWEVRSCGERRNDFDSRTVNNRRQLI